MNRPNKAGGKGVLVITGAAGVGKTKLLSLAVMGGVRLGLVDALTVGICATPKMLELAMPTSLADLDQDYVDVVAVDHVGDASAATEPVQEAADWAAQHGKPLWLLGLTSGAIEALDLELHGPIAELALRQGYQVLGADITLAHGRQWLMPAFVKLKMHHEAVISPAEQAEFVNSYWGVC